jgi:hypothetical protein
MGVPQADASADLQALVECRPVVAAAVDAWRSTVNTATAGLPAEPTVDEHNDAWALAERRAGGVRSVLHELADLIAGADEPAPYAGGLQ